MTLNWSISGFMGRRVPFKAMADPEMPAWAREGDPVFGPWRKARYRRLAMSGNIWRGPILGGLKHDG
ncbi:hypothetical protein [Nitrosomonas sp. ANs5]|uniref:hypothetical protein n=1 Tax=Nitrosomonas sp. ANs5 TaxID=3423941 RepID=UPI003D33919F